MKFEPVVGWGALPDGWRYVEVAGVAVDKKDNVFCFSRPIYDDASWVPAQLEYGVFHEPRRMSVRMFPNKRPGRLSSL